MFSFDRLKFQKLYEPKKKKKGTVIEININDFPFETAHDI